MFYRRVLVVLVALSFATPLRSVHAAITPEGDISPADPSTWTSDTDGYIGNTASGTLTVDGGSGLLSYDGYIGSGSGSVGVVSVTGTGSTWTNGGYISVGDSGNGLLSIANCGSVRNSWAYSIGSNRGSTGSVTVAGIGSTLINTEELDIGYFGSGTLSISDGGSVSSGHQQFCSFIGHGSRSSGVVSVAGTGSTWTNGSSLLVGYGGKGSLLITNGGSVSNWDSLIGANFGSTGSVTVDGIGSNWTGTAQLTVGFSGSGTMSITNGGSVSSTDPLVGYSSSSKGAVTVNGAGSTWTMIGSLHVGEGGSGTLSISNGGSVYIAGTGTAGLGVESGSKGLVTVDGTGSTWTNNYDLVVGSMGSGTLSISNSGSATINGRTYIGDYSNSTGVVSVDGSGSIWTNIGSVDVGVSGSGRMAVTNGGNVSVAGSTSVGTYGTIDFGTNGGTLTTNSLFIASPTQLAGTGTINTNGLVSDMDVRFDSTHGLRQAMRFQQTGQDVMVNLDVGTGIGSLGAGCIGNGSLTVQDAIKVNCDRGILGYKNGASGVATVTGMGSSWASKDFLIGYRGSGKLSVTKGGGISGDGIIGSYEGSTGIVKVDGTGSTWTNTALFIGNAGNGILSITGGGAVQARNISLGRWGILSIDVGRGSSLTSDSLTYQNNGIFRILAGAGVAGNTTFSPFLKTWSGGTGTYQAIGGKLNASHLVFTTSTITPGTSGSVVALNLASVQRTLVSDFGTGWTVGASFPAMSVTTSMTFTATAMNDTALNPLRSLLPSGESVLSGWDFAGTNYTVSSTNPVYLSFKVGPGRSADQLDLWHYAGGAWTKVSPFDLTYDGTYASFTASSFSGYAMSAVPEPGTVALLAMGLLSLMVFGRRKRKQA
jgi:T5SS/PEP-CTERM-associated repeat protein